MREFFFIRHGQARSGVSRMDRDFDLTARGREQAHALGKSLRSGGAAPHCIYCSRLTRARQTAAILSEYFLVPIHERRDLIEHGSGAYLLECSLEEAVRRHPDKLNPDGQPKTVQGDAPNLNWSFSIGGEDMRALHARARRAWEALRNEAPAAGQCLVVSHGSFLSALLTEALGLPLRPFWNFQFSNAGCIGVRVFSDSTGRAYPAVSIGGPFGD